MFIAQFEHTATDKLSSHLLLSCHLNYSQEELLTLLKVSDFMVLSMFHEALSGLLMTIIYRVCKGAGNP